MTRKNENIKNFSQNHFETKSKATILRMQIHTTVEEQKKQATDRK